MDREGLNGFELVVLVAGVASVVVIGVVWGGAVLALVVVGEARLVTFGDAAGAATRLVGNLSQPGEAWRHPIAGALPGPVVYWVCTTAVAVPVGLATEAVLRRILGPRVGTARRRPLGVDARPWFAAGRDLRPLLVRGPVPGRFIVACLGRWLVATESRATADGQPAGPRILLRSSTARRGDRGALALVGPSRSGKTAAAVGGILDWTGPAVLSSVKADLLGSTLGERSERGDVRVYDPTASTRSGAAPARWSPIRQADTVVGAQRAARMLCDAAPREGVDGGLDFWLAQAEILLSGLLFTAHHANRDMAAVCQWVLTQDRPGDLGPGEVRVALDRLAADDDEGVVLGAAEALRSLTAIWEMEDRTRSSTYATAQTVVWPWSAPGVAASSCGESLDLTWLLSGENTVYLCAPIEDQRRLAPAFGGLLNDLIGQAYRHVAATGKPVEPPLLIVIDEAGNTPLRALPEYASTLAGIGVQLVTIWQSLAQVESAYGRQADTILTNHLTKLFYAGLSDPASLRYVAQVLGDAEVDTVSRSAAESFGRSSIQLATTRTALAPAHALRQMRPGDALMVHGTLPPAHVRTRPFYRDRRLAALASKPLSRRCPAAADDNQDESAAAEPASLTGGGLL